MTNQAIELKTEDRLLAAVSHADIIAQGVGVMIGLVVYLTQKDRSPYAAFQGIQATIYQIACWIIAIAAWLLWGLFYMLSFIPIIFQIENNPEAAPPIIFWIALGSMIIPMGLMIILGVYGLVAAGITLAGKPFRYWIIGSLVEKWIFKGQPVKTTPAEQSV